MRKTILYILVICSLCFLSKRTYSQVPDWTWAKEFSGMDDISIYSSAVDNEGNLYTTGFFNGTADFDPGTGTYNLTASNSDLFISKLDAAGNFVWAKKIGGTIDEVGYSIAIDNSGNVYTTGIFYGTVDFDPGIGIFNLTSSGNKDYFVTKLDSSGNFIWAVKIGSTNPETVYSIAIDNFANVYTTGTYIGIVDFDPDTGTFNLNSGSLYSIFISKLDSSGNFVWAKSIGGNNNETVFSMDVDDSGNVAITGSLIGTADFDPSAGTYNLTSNGSADIFILKLDYLGNFSWAKHIGGTGNDNGRYIKIDSIGNVYTTGDFYGIVDFDPGPVVYNLNSQSGSEVFILKLNKFGNFLWANNFSAISSSYHSIAIDNSGDVYFTGSFQGTVDFDPSPSIFNLTSNGEVDAIILKQDSLGNFKWAKHAGGIKGDFATTITLNSMNDVFIAGSFKSDSVAFGTTILTNLDSSGNTWNGFIAKLKNTMTENELIQNTNAISIFPNPTTDKFTIILPEKAIIEILNIEGKIIESKKVNDSQINIDVSYFSSGVYIIKAITDKGIAINKLIKK